MKKSSSVESRFKGLKIAITGSSGSLGQALIKEFKEKGAYVVGLTHSKEKKNVTNKNNPNDWIIWSCGEEKLLSSKLVDFDILILNHGINPKGLINSTEINKAIEINSLSSWRLIQIFEDIASQKDIKNEKRKPMEIWINTSEAEIQIAFSPVYEITKRLIGELVSLKKSNLSIEREEAFTIKKLIIGPFKSNLNPQGIMSADFVAKKIISSAKSKKYLIIVSPNPLTYLFMPIIEGIRIIYSKLIHYLYTRKYL